MEVPIRRPETEERDTATAFEAVKTVLQNVGYEPSHLTQRGHLSRTIISVAKEVDADLIVLGARGHSAIYRLILGSTADFVACDVSYPVLEAVHVGDALLDLAESKKINLLFVGAAGKSALARFFLGSTSRYLLNHVACSVWIARKKDWK